jgi:glycosyltransferase involved in cell wall biosynthesis
MQVDASILLTNPEQFNNLAPMELPADIPVVKLPVPAGADWPMRWRCMIRYLENEKPCILLPNYDWDHCCVAPKLSSQIGIVSIVHSDDEVRWYQNVPILAPYCNALVAVSAKIAEEVQIRNPDTKSRVHVISHGVCVSPSLPARRLDRPLQLIYAGRLVQEQKRVFDLPRIMSTLIERNVPAELSIIGGGPDEAALRQHCQPLLARGEIRFCGILNNAQVLASFEQADVLLLTSEFEGLPVTLLEAMGRGCIPVVTDIRSGIPEVVQNEVNGFCVPVGDIEAFVERLNLLHRETVLRRQMSERAYTTVSQGGYRIEDMATSYVQLFDRVMEDARSGVFRRPRGKIVPPPWLVEKPKEKRNGSWKDNLPASLRSAARRAKQSLRRMAGRVG